jgi:hypothetical protein
MVNDQCKPIVNEVAHNGNFCEFMARRELRLELFNFRLPFSHSAA